MESEKILSRPKEMLVRAAAFLITISFISSISIFGSGVAPAEETGAEAKQQVDSARANNASVPEPRATEPQE